MCSCIHTPLVQPTVSPSPVKKEIQLVKQRISKGKTIQPKVALTYDMESYNRETEKLLQLFRLWNIQVTFFIQGGFIESSSREVKSIVSEGHEIGNHSWSHADLLTLSDDQIRWQVTKNEEALMQHTGVSPKPLFRCPYGSCNQHVRDILFDLGYMEIFWTNDTNDWQDDSKPKEMIQHVVDNLEPGMIVLMHNIGQYTVETTATLITEIQNKGYIITTVSDVLE